MKISRLIIWSVAALTISAPVNADNLPDKPGPARTVKMFDTFCLSVVPDISRTAKAAAAGSFRELKGKRLEKYQPEVRAEELRAWTFQDFGSDFVITTTRSKPDAQFKKQVPKFADSKTAACSMIIPAKEPKARVLQEMNGLLSREPDKAWNQGPFRVHSWGGQTKSLLIIVYFYAPTKNGQNGILSTTTFVKN
jgi:hypothetical protein